MTISHWLNYATETLKKTGITTARLDSQILLEFVLGFTRAQLLANGDIELSISQETESGLLLSKRRERTPMAYIIGKKEFYGREFIVNPDVLIPRPESESFIEISSQIALPTGSLVVDVGTGSGAIGISYALSHPNIQVELRDISLSALTIAQKNAVTLKASNCNFVATNLLDELPRNSELIFANLPYVPTSIGVEPELDYEPKIALYSGSDGLYLYKLFFEQLRILQIKPKNVLTESLPEQHHKLTEFALKAGYKLSKTDGLVQLFQLINI